MSRILGFFLLNLTVAIVAPRPRTLAQDALWLTVGFGDYNNPSNWTTNSVPSAFDGAIIANGGTAQVSNTPQNPLFVNVVEGGLEVENGGTLSPRAVGVAASGIVTVESGGVLNAGTLSNDGWFNLIGSNANANVDLISLNPGGTFSATISSPVFQPLVVKNNALLGGALEIDFGEFVPNPGDTFNVIDAANVLGNFSSINVAGDSTLEDWQTFLVRTIAGGSQGNVVEASLRERLVAVVDRQSGDVLLSNQAGNPLSLDGYTITSALGSLDPQSVNSFTSQGLDAGAWREIGTRDSKLIGELNPLGNGTIDVSSSRSIGNVYNSDPSALPLGVEPEDLVFTYTTPTGETIDGAVVYQGDKLFNNLVVVVDSNSGEATLQNQSPREVSIDGYAVTSASGSLLKDWNSFEDQGAAEWFETLTDANQIGELQRSGATMLNSGSTIDFGTLFNTSGVQDLKFEFLLDDKSTSQTGVVAYTTSAPLAAHAQLGVPEPAAGAMALLASGCGFWRRHRGRALHAVR